MRPGAPPGGAHRERYAEIRGRVDAGESLSAISRVTGLDRKTVQRFAQAGSAGELPGKATSRESKLDKFTPYLHQRWNEGVTDAAGSTPNCRQRGWSGSEQTVRRYVRPFRHALAAPGPAPAAPKTRQITRWLLTRPDHLQADEQAQLEAVRARCPHIDALAGHVTAFAEMMTARTGSRDLEGWLAAAEADDQSGLRSFLRHPHRHASSHQRPHPALELRHGRGHGQQDQDDQAPDVRPHWLRPATKTRYLAPCVTGSQNSRQSHLTCPRGNLVRARVVHHRNGDLSPFQGSTPRLVGRLPRFAGSSGLKRPGQPGGGAWDRRA